MRNLSTFWGHPVDSWMPMLTWIQPPPAMPSFFWFALASDNSEYLKTLHPSRFLTDFLVIVSDNEVVLILAGWCGNNNLPNSSRIPLRLRTIYRLKNTLISYFKYEMLRLVGHDFKGDWVKSANKYTLYNKLTGFFPIVGINRRRKREVACEWGRKSKSAEVGTEKFQGSGWPRNF